MAGLGELTIGVNLDVATAALVAIHQQVEALEGADLVLMVAGLARIGTLAQEALDQATVS